jgi:uncharacterized protein YkwD
MLRSIGFFALLGFLLFACPSIGIATQVFDRSVDPQEKGLPVTGAYAFGSCGGPDIASINPGFEQSIIEQTNAIRKQYQLPPLKKQEDLGLSARYHAADMSASDYFSHDTYGRVEGKLDMVCDTWKRIETYYPEWQALAENIAAGQRTPEMAMEGWMNSPDHRHNILSDSYTEIGVGYYEGEGEYRYYWDQNFGRRSDIYPLILDGEKAETSAHRVPVYIYGSFDRMRLRNNSDEWSDWIPFENDFSWDLPNKAGLHTVTIELQGAQGFATSSDTIKLAP